MRAISSIKLVATDVDGTLINDDLVIPESARAAIAAARRKGIKFTIASGRMFQSASRLAQELGLDEVPLITYSGALTREFPSGRLIQHEPLPLETCKAVAAYCEAHGYHLQAYLNDEVYVPDMGRHTQRYITITKVEPHPVGSLFLWMTQPSTKLLLIDDVERIPAIQAELQELVGPAVEVAPSIPGMMEIVNARATKGEALRAVAESLGLDRSEVMAIGDGMNDISMLSWAGTSFAVSHAVESVKAAATHVTQAGAGDCIAEALERMGLVS